MMERSPYHDKILHFVFVMLTWKIYRIIIRYCEKRFLGHEWGDLPIISWANRITSDPQIVIHGNECIILFITRYFMSWTHNSAKNNYRLLISPLSPRTVFSGLTLWRHQSWSVTPCVRVVLALWCHIRRLLLHVQIGIKAIFISERQPWISISHQPVFTA